MVIQAVRLNEVPKGVSIDGEEERTKGKSQDLPLKEVREK